MATTVTIDFNKAPDLGWGHSVRSIERHLEFDFSPFTETYDRAKGAYWFSHLIDSTDIDVKNRECYLRASLAEFSSMEDALKRDVKKIDPNSKPLRMKDCQEPEIHIVRELRNIELHLQSSSLRRDKRSVLIGEDDLEITIWFAHDLSYDKIQPELYNAKRYEAEDLRRLIDWFNDAQKVFGVGEVIRRAVLAFARNIWQSHKL